MVSKALSRSLLAGILGTAVWSIWRRRARKKLAAPGDPSGAFAGDISDCGTAAARKYRRRDVFLGATNRYDPPTAPSCKSSTAFCTLAESPAMFLSVYPAVEMGAPTRISSGRHLMW